MVELTALLPQIDAWIAQVMEAQRLPGLALALTDRERLLHVAAYGWADVAAGKPATPDTLFEIGSISKSFTAIALLQLAEAGQIDLHAPVTRYLPWFHVPSPHEPITLHHLLTHSAGIITGTDFTTEARYEVWALRESMASTPPGSRFHYSNVGYKALGLVLETVLGQSLAQILRQRLLDPLGMAASEPVITHETRRRLAVGYDFFYDDRPAHSSDPLVPATWFETGTADGSIAATAADMAAYLRMLLNRGQGPDGRLLSEASFALLTQQAVVTSDKEGDFYGYGLFIPTWSGHAPIGHSGGMVGYVAEILGDLVDGLGVVLLVNGRTETYPLARALLEFVCAAWRGDELPALPPSDPKHVENGADYAGNYRGPEGELRLMDEGGRLVLHLADRPLLLERCGEDCFVVPHADWRLLPLRFRREAGRVVEALHGARWYARDGGGEWATFNCPAEWAAYPGHYRAHNPWVSNVRVVLRKGQLLLIEPPGEEHALAPLGDGRFRVGEEGSPEYIAFDTPIDGRTVRANWSGCFCYRTFTP